MKKSPASFLSNRGRIRRIVAALHDAAMAALSFLLSIYLRLPAEEWPEAKHYLVIGTVVFTLVCVSVFVSMRLYRGLWRFASMRDLLAILQAVTLSILIFALLMFFINRLEGMPRSLFLINWMLLLIMLGGPRFIYRAFKDRTLFWEMTLQEKAKIPVLLVGGSGPAEQFIRNSARDPRAPYQVVGILDEDPRRHGGTIHGVPIYGSAQALAVVVRKLDRKAKRPQKIVLSEQMSGEVVQSLLEEADRLGLPLARLQEMSVFRQGVVDKPDIAPIAIEDLLGRPQNVLDREKMRALVAGKRVLVTGAGGTIGGELARQVAGWQPDLLILFDISEYALYQIEKELRQRFETVPMLAMLGDVRSQAHLDALFAAHSPQLVFHAAAIKHVPIAEENIEETILTNVYGTQVLAEAAMRGRAQAMVMISTDKAVNPSSVMGASKRLAEGYCQALGRAQDSVAFITVRFGNVLGSTGSVVPLFKEQLERGGPLTVTHAEMTRYFMTVREAVELVLEAAALGQSMVGRRDPVFVLDMGKPVKILDLARQMIRLAGLEPDQDISIIFTGLRKGEKLHEELFHASENLVKTSHARILLASPRTASLAELQKSLAMLHQACEKRDSSEALALLKRLVPEFTHDD